MVGLAVDGALVEGALLGSWDSVVGEDVDGAPLGSWDSVVGDAVDGARVQGASLGS